MQCSVGSCVGGLATQDPDHVNRYETEHRGSQMHRYLESIRWQIASIVHTLGYNDIRQVSSKDLVALTPGASALTRLPYEPGYRVIKSVNKSNKKEL